MKKIWGYHCLTQQVDGQTQKLIYVSWMDRILGKLEVTDWEKEGAWVVWLYVDPEFRRQGIASSLLDGLESEARAAAKKGYGLAVEPGNQAAIELYTMQGLIPCYTSGKSIVMTKHLDGGFENYE